MERPEIEVGRTLREMASQAGVAWKAVEEGRMPSPRVGIYFRDWSALNAVLTPKRYDLLRHLRRERVSGVRALARSLGRDVKRVHEDVVALAEIGLLTRADDGSLSSDVDEIGSTIHIATSPKEKFQEIPSDMRQLAEKGVDLARRAFDGFIIDAQRGAGQAEAGSTASRTADKTIGTKVMSFAESSIRSTFDFALKVVCAKDLEEVVALQAEYAKAQTMIMQEQARELETLALTAVEDDVRSASADVGKCRKRVARRIP